jgi:transposase
MYIKSFQSIVKTEKTAHSYLLENCFGKKKKITCPRCKSKKVYKLKKRYRCSICKYDFTEFTGRWFNQVHISTVQWLWLIKLFELEISTRKISKQLGISYPTALKATNLIRRCITAHNSNGNADLLKGEVEADEAYFGGRRKGKRGRGAAGKVPVFGILERKGIVNVEVVPDVSAKTLLDLTVKKVRRGSIVYTDKYKSYDSLMFCGYRHLQIDHKKYFSSGKVYINGVEGFWSFAKERFIKYHGVSKNKFSFYLKEMEFRYNNRYNDDIFEIVVSYLTNLVENRL